MGIRCRVFYDNERFEEWLVATLPQVGEIVVPDEGGPEIRIEAVRRVAHPEGETDPHAIVCLTAVRVAKAEP